MKCGLLLLVVVCTAASVAEDFIKSSPPAPGIAEFQFSTPQAGTKELANTMEQKKKTTKRRTTTLKPTTTEKTTTTTEKPITTTTEKPITTTTEKPITTTTPKPTTTTAKPITTTTAKPITTTTAKPITTTTVKPVTTTTEKPITTTTAKPNTTTSKPITTTTGKPNTTTSKPTTTTGKPTTTTVKPQPPKPTPAAPLIMGKYNITKDGATCLLAHMALQIRLSNQVNGTFTVQPNKTNTRSSSCQRNTASLNITFDQGYILLKYDKNTTGNSVYVKALSFSLSYPLSPTVDKYSRSNESLHLFAARVGHSYSCRNDSIHMGNGLYLDVTQDRMQAFNFTASNEFGVSDPCPADVPTYSVAIAVGVILLVLIIIVVVAYVVGRRRRASGYQAL